MQIYRPRLRSNICFTLIVSGSLCQAMAQQQGTQGLPSQSSNLTPSQTTTLHVISQLVVLDVVVTGKSGALRTDLEKKDFHVTENGVPQTILHFEAPTEHVMPRGAPITSTAELEKRAPQAPVTIIVLDELNTRFEDMGFARYALQKYLSAQPTELSAPTMLLAVSAERMQVLMDYTQDRAVILEALKKHLASYPWQTQRDQNLFQQLVQSLGVLEQVTQATAGHPGHKNLLWVGHGFPGIDLSNPNMDQTKADGLREAVEQAVDIMRDSRMTLYTIDPTAMSSIVSTKTDDNSGPLGDIVDPATDPFVGDVNFIALAKATGGRSFFSRNDLDAEIGESARDGLNYYTITYRPTSQSSEERAYRKIRVTFTQPGLKAGLRDGYYTQDSAQVAPAANRSIYDVDAAIENTMAYTGLSVQAVERPGSPGSYVVGIPETQIPWEIDGAEESSKLTIVVADIDAKGKILRRVNNDLTARRPIDGQSSSKQEFVRADINLPLAAGTRKLRFVVRSVGNGRIGTYDLVPPEIAGVSKAGHK